MKNLVVVTLIASLGCSAGVKPSQTGTGGTGLSGEAGIGGGGSTGNAGTTGNAGSTGSAGTAGGVDSGVGPDAACATESTGAMPVPLDLYMMMDTSKSMNDATSAGPTKWDAVRSAMNAFFTDGASAGLGVGLKYFPGEQPGVPDTCTMDSDCTAGGTSYGPCDWRLGCVRMNTSSVVDTGTQLCPTMTTACSGAMEVCDVIYDCGAGVAPCVKNGSGMCTGCTPYTGYCHSRDICTSTSYGTPDVAIATLPGAATALATSLTGQSPGGYTPTGPALKGALDFAKQRLATVTDHKIAVVLVTDGLPGGFIPGFPPAECTPADIPGIANIAMTAATGTPPVLTFVIGVFKPTEAATAQSNLDMLAQAGGTNQAVVIDTGQNVTQALQTALKQVQTKAIACSYKIPPPTHGNIDFGKVNVQFTTGAGDMTTIGHTTSKAACTQGGWYYDVDPAVGTPTEIIACDSTCANFQNDVTGHVDIVLGCMTITVG